MGPADYALLLDRHGPALVLYARQWCDAPEDVVQDGFVALFGLRAPPRDPVAWLYRVVRNGAIDAGRMEQRRQRREACVARSTRWFVEPEVEGLDADVAVAALTRLPLDQREAIVAHLWGGLRFEQIGELAGCSASSAHRRYSAGLASLREILEGAMSDPLAERLTRFTPESGLDRDALLFRAGQLAARPRPLWKWLAVALVCTQALTLALLWPRSPAPVADPPPAVVEPSPPPSPVPPDSDLPLLTWSEGLVPDAPPLRAFGAPPTDVY